MWFQLSKYFSSKKEKKKNFSRDRKISIVDYLKYGRNERDEKKTSNPSRKKFFFEW